MTSGAFEPPAPAAVIQRVHGRIGSDVGSGAPAAIQLWCRQGRVQHDAGAVKANLDQRAAEKKHDMPGRELTPSVGWSAYFVTDGVKSSQGRGRPVVDGELEGSLRARMFLARACVG